MPPEIALFLLDPHPKMPNMEKSFTPRPSEQIYG
jgi:hypothetical protein